MRYRFGLESPATTYVGHDYMEQSIDLGEVTMNFVKAGRQESPALLLIPGQTESWWGYEPAIKLLEDSFNVYAVDLRGQGRSSRTPGRYTLDNMGNDLVRFAQMAIKRPTIVSGLSSGGVLSAWLSAYAPPGLVTAACYEDPPLFSSELAPAFGQGIRQGPVGPILKLYAQYLGDQWSVGDWEGAIEAAPSSLPEWVIRFANFGAEPPQGLREYDPEWARSFYSGAASASCAHEPMLKRVKVPVLFTHHFRAIEPETGALMGAISDLQADCVRRLIEGADQRFDYRSFPQMGHSMHKQDPKLFVDTLREWITKL